MMRIAHIIDSLKLGGAEQLLTLFAREARTRNANVTIISLRSEADPNILKRLQEDGAKIYLLPASRGMSPVRLARLTRLLRAKKIQIAQTHLSTSNIVGTLACHLSGIKSIATLHSVSIDPRYYHPVRQELETRMLRHLSRRVVAVGESVAFANQQRLKRPIDVIPNAVTPHTQISQQDRMEIRRSLGENAEDPFVITVGRHSAPKGYSVLVDAFAQLHRSHPRARLFIVGQGILQNELQTQIEKLRLQNVISLLGRREDVAQLLGASDVYVSSSLWEGLPVSVLEAMSAGLPVVATEVGDMPRIVNPSVGVLVPPNDSARLAEALRKILDDNRSAAEMGTSARNFVNRYHHPSVWMDHLMQLYEQVLSGRKLEKVV